MRSTLLSLTAVLAVAGVLATAPADEPPGRATYQGRTIYLSQGWQGASACAVFDLDHAECFDSFEEMEAATTEAPSDRGVVALGASGGGAVAAEHLAADCNGQSTVWLYLYEHANFGGRVLKFNDIDYWQNLSNWSFNDQMTSYDNDTACTTYLAEHSNGGGSWLFAYAGTANANVGATWNDRVSSLYIDG